MQNNWFYKNVFLHRILKSKQSHSSLNVFFGNDETKISGGKFR